MPATCGHCGGTVMTYGRYFLHSRPTATCDACGRTVRLRHFWKAVGLAGLAFAVLLASLVLVESITAWGIMVAVLAAGILALDRWSWQTWPWDAVGSDATGAQAPENGGRQE